jgi:hypothetical protein
MNTLILALAGALAAAAAGPAAATTEARVSRAKIAAIEKFINNQFVAMYPEEPYFLIGLARGVYIEGYGAVFSAEINLATGASISPFKQTITREEIQRHKEKKEARMPPLRASLSGIVTTMNGYLETLPPNEEYVLAVTLLRYPWEEAAVPHQIVMRVQRARMLEALRSNARPETAIRTQEY